MTKRECKYFKEYRWRKTIRQITRKMSEQVYDSLFWVGAAASHVYKGDNGEVHIEILTPEQCLDLMSWDKIPEEITLITN